MIDLYRTKLTAEQVGERFQISARSVRRLMKKHGVRKRA